MSGTEPRNGVDRVVERVDREPVVGPGKYQTAGGTAVVSSHGPDDKLHGHVPGQLTSTWWHKDGRHNTFRDLDLQGFPLVPGMGSVSPREVVEVSRLNRKQSKNGLFEVEGVLGRDGLGRSYAGVTRPGQKVTFWHGPHESERQSSSIAGIEVQRELSRYEEMQRRPRWRGMDR